MAGYSVNFPDDWRELYVNAYLGDSTSYTVPVTVIKRDTLTLGNDHYYIRGGYSSGAASGGEGGEVVFEVTSTSIRLAFAMLNGVDVKSISNARVYYKPGYKYYL